MCCRAVLILCVAIILKLCLCVPSVVRIGVIYKSEDSNEEKVTKEAIEWVNGNKDILPNTKLELKSAVAPTNDEFQNIQQTCELIKENIAVLIGPSTSNSVKASLPLITEFEVPAIAPVATDPTLEDYVKQFKYSLRLLPTDTVQAEAIIDFIDVYDKTYIAILAEDSDYGLNGMLQVQALAAMKGWRVLCAQHFATGLDHDRLDLENELTQIKNLGTHFVILFTDANHSLEVFKQAKELGLMDEGWVWIVTDAVTGYAALPSAVAKHPYLKNIIGTQPLSGQKGKFLYPEFERAWNKVTSKSTNNSVYSQAFFDAVLVSAYALDAAIKEDPSMKAPEGMDCDIVPVNKWPYGKLVFSKMVELSKPGVRHELKFDKESGLPANPSYTYVQLRDQGWVTIGGWKKANASIVNPYQLESLGGKRVIEIRDYQPSLSGKILKVVTLMEPPFVMLDPNHDNPDKPCKFSHCFDGYAIELLDKIAQIHRFTYTLYLSPDGEYGRKSKGPNGNEQWTGMVKELLKENAQMAVGAFTVSSDREKVISFTKPYRDLQMSVLVGQSAKTEYNPFSFLVPFEPRLWIYIILTGLSIGIYLAIVDKLSPYGHHGKKVQNESEDEFEEMDINEDGTIDEWERRNWIREKEAMNFHNAIFWSFASFFEQGGEYHPRAWSGRIVAAAWWFGIVIIIATYTANLAAFLTIKTSKDAINSAQDLAKQDKIRYTYIKGTEVETFFERHSNDPLGKEPYKHMGQKILGWKESEKNPLPVFTRTNDTVEQLKSMNGSLALITDGVLTDYWRGQKCDDVRVLKKRFAHIGYAFGLPIESMFRDELSLEVLKLRENGDIDKLDFKWLVSTSLCKEESKVKEGSAENQQVTLASMLGVFYVVYAGFSIAIVVLVFEWIVSCFQSIDTDHPRRPTSFKQAFQDKLHRLKVDFLENWFPCKLRNTNESEKLFAVRRVPPLAVVNRTVTVDGETGPVSARTRGNAWN